MYTYTCVLNVSNCVSLPLHSSTCVCAGMCPCIVCIYVCKCAHRGIYTYMYICIHVCVLCVSMHLRRCKGLVWPVLSSWDCRREHSLPNFSISLSVCLSIFLYRDTILRVSGTCCFSQSLAHPPLFCCTHLGVGGDSGPVTSSSLLLSPF